MTKPKYHPVEEIGLRELRQNASDVVRRAEAGEEFVITVSGRPAARLTGTGKKTWCAPSDLAAIFAAPSWGDSSDIRDALDQTVRDPWEGRE